MRGTKLDIATEDGLCDAYISHPDGAGPWPGVLLLQDGMGPRPTLYAMADRLAGHGYYVVLPNLYWRFGDYPPIDPEQVFQGGAEMERVLDYVARVTDDNAMRDTRAFLAHLDDEPRVRGPRYGVAGYCMGGALAVCAACHHADRFAAALSIHGSRFLVEPSSAPVIAARARCEIYIAVAEVDRRHDAAVSARLEEALTAAGVPHAIELYPGVAHGFAVPDLPPYDEAAAERHWTRMLDVLQRNLG